jgi:hypothetical protein
MTTALQKARAKLRSRDIRVTVMKLVDPATGEEIGALVPDHPIDRRSMRERKFNVGKQLRATLRQDRNPLFYRKAHVLSGWLADNVEAFSGLSQHDALKKLQELSGIGCETVEYDLPGVGKLTRTEAESLNFADVDEGRFNELWDGGTGEGGWIGWLRREVFGGLDATSREEVEKIIQKPEQGA